MKKKNNTQSQVGQNIGNKASTIKLSIDVHGESYRVVRQIDGSSPQPAQKFSPEGFLKFARKQLDLAEEVHSCYEAGPFGFGLHRRLSEMGVQNVVIRPFNWDEQHKGVKTDKTDALAMAHRLDQYVRGNVKALAVVSVPSVEQEKERAESRHREDLQKHRQRVEAQGRSLMLYRGISRKGRWWAKRAWAELQGELESDLLDILSSLREIILVVDAKLREVTAKIEKKSEALPKGLGALTMQIIDREVFDWNRFKNRRTMASYTGACPSVRASGQSIRMGPITKHGNPRLRRVSIEAAWRLVRFQPKYPPVQRWIQVLGSTASGAGMRKKAIVAIARKLVIDLWRVRTNRTTFEQVGLKMA